MTQRCNAPLPIPTRTHEPQCHGLVRGNIIPQNGPTRPPIQEQTDQELKGEGLPTQLDQTVQLTEPADQVQLIPEQQSRTRFMTSREVEEDDVDARVKVDVAQSDFKWQEYKMQRMVLEQQSNMWLLMARQGAKDGQMQADSNPKTQGACQASTPPKHEHGSNHA